MRERVIGIASFTFCAVVLGFCIYIFGVAFDGYDSSQASTLLAFTFGSLSNLLYIFFTGFGKRKLSDLDQLDFENRILQLKIKQKDFLKELNNQESGEESTPISEPIPKPDNAVAKKKEKRPSIYRTNFLFALGFSLLSIFLWSYVFTGWRFDIDIFLGRLINHSLWLLLFPFLISLFFSKERRTSVYGRVVSGAIVIGSIFLVFGFIQMRNANDPIIIRVELKQPCVENVINQMKKRAISEADKKVRAMIYCDCIIEKITDEDIRMIGRREKPFFSTIEQSYPKESLACVEESLKEVDLK